MTNKNKTIRFSVSEEEYKRIKELSYIKETSMSDLIRTEIFRMPLFQALIDNEDQRVTVSFNKEEFERLESDRRDQDRSMYLIRRIQEGLNRLENYEITLEELEELKGSGTEMSVKIRIPGNFFTKIQLEKPPFVSITKWIAVLILAGAETFQEF